MIKRWLHANLNVRSLDRSVRFYEDLGFRKIYEKSVEDPRTWAKLGLKPGKMRYAILQLTPKTPVDISAGRSLPGDLSFPVIDMCELIDPPPQGEPYPSLSNLGIGRLCFEVEDIDEAYEMLKAKGVEFLGPVAPAVRQDGTMYLFCFKDPDGIIIELGGPRKNV